MSPAESREASFSLRQQNVRSKLHIYQINFEKSGVLYKSKYKIALHLNNDKLFGWRQSVGCLFSLFVFNHLSSLLTHVPVTGFQ